jgi:hypothetical protein
MAEDQRNMAEDQRKIAGYRRLLVRGWEDAVASGGRIVAGSEGRLPEWGVIGTCLALERGPTRFIKREQAESIP